MQCEPGHRKRKGLKAQGLEWTDKRFEPDRHELSGETSDEIAERYRSAAIRALATMLISPSFLSIDHQHSGVAQKNALRMCHAFVEGAKKSGALAGSPAGGPRRLVVAALAIHGGSLTPALARNLVSAYAEADADAFLLWAWNFTGQASHFQRIRELARALQRQTGKACIVGGLGDLWMAALRNGVASACTGHGRARLAWPPREMPFDAEGNVKGFGINLYLPGILGSVQIGEPGRVKRQALLLEEPCWCGHHLPTVDPAGAMAFHAHNLHWLEEETLSAIRDVPRQATLELAKRTLSARQNRLRVSAGPLVAAWTVACEGGSPNELLAPPGTAPWRHLALARA